MPRLAVPEEDNAELFQSAAALLKKVHAEILRAAQPDYGWESTIEAVGIGPANRITPMLRSVIWAEIRKRRADDPLADIETNISLLGGFAENLRRIRESSQPLNGACIRNRIASFALGVRETCLAGVFADSPVYAAADDLFRRAIKEPRESLRQNGGPVHPLRQLAA